MDIKNKDLLKVKTVQTHTRTIPLFTSIVLHAAGKISPFWLTAELKQVKVSRVFFCCILFNLFDQTQFRFW